MQPTQVQSNEISAMPAIVSIATFEELRRTGHVDRACAIAIKLHVLRLGERLTVDNFVAVHTRIVDVITRMGFLAR